MTLKSSEALNNAQGASPDTFPWQRSGFNSSKTGLRKVVIIYRFKILISKKFLTKVEITLFFQHYLPIGNHEISVMIRSLSSNHYLLKE